MTRETSQCLLCYRDSPFSKSEVGHILGILNLLCCISCSRNSCLAFIKILYYNNSLPLRDPKQGTHSVLSKLIEVYHYMFLFRLTEAFSGVVFDMPRGIFKFAGLMISPVRIFMFHERNLVDGICSTSLGSCEEGSLFSYVREAEPWSWFAVKGRAPLCFTRLVFSYCSRGRFLHNVFHLIYFQDVALEGRYLHCEARLLPNEVCGLPCVVCCHAYFSLLIVPPVLFCLLEEIISGACHWYSYSPLWHAGSTWSVIFYSSHLTLGI